MLEPLLNLLLIAGILYLARLGTLFGLFYELVVTTLVIFASLLTFRHWHWLAQLLQERGWMASPYAEFGSYWILFLIGCLPLVWLARYLTDESRPLYPKWLDTLGGAALGLAGGIILACVIVTSVTVLGPAFTPRYDRTMLWFPYDAAALKAYRHIEQQIGAPAATRLPNFDSRDPANPVVSWY